MKDGYTVLLHLSDVHFNDKRKGFLDLDTEVRAQLERDCGRVKSTLGPVDAILVTGDIAYRALPEEYDRATIWLERLASQLDCRPERTFLTPGNHDVDRSVIRQSEFSRLMHDDLRTGNSEAIDEKLAKKFRDRMALSSLYRPIENYSRFALQFECDIGPDRQVWESDLPLNDGSTLRLVGLNSTLISDDFDNDTDHKLVLGSYQCSFVPQDGLEFLTLCHHPPQWLRDEDAVAASLKARVRVQLFGHKHKQVLDQINGTVRLTAGAVHPDRQEDSWQPRYNFIAIRVEGVNKERKLHVQVHPREWSEESRDFAPDYDGEGKETREYKFNLKPWSSPGGLGDDGTNSGTNEAERLTASLGQSAGMDARRRLTYRYYGLSFSERLAVAQALELVEDEDKDVAEAELFRRFFQRAAERTLLARLWEEVEARHDDDRGRDNPFAGR